MTGYPRRAVMTVQAVTARIPPFPERSPAETRAEGLPSVHDPTINHQANARS